MYTVKGYCAGICIFAEDVEHNKFKKFLEEKKNLLIRGELQITFGGMVQSASELCYDVYDKETSVWRNDLSRAFKV